MSLAAENELGWPHQEAAEGSQRSFPAVLTSGTEQARRRGLLSFLPSFPPRAVLGKRGKCGNDSGLGNGLTPGVGWALERGGLVSGSLHPAEHSSSIPATACPLLGFLSALCLSQAAALPRCCLLERAWVAAGCRKPARGGWRGLGLPPAKGHGCREVGVAAQRQRRCCQEGTRGLARSCVSVTSRPRGLTGGHRHPVAAGATAVCLALV